MDINLELYKVFYYVATTLSFSEASRQLFLSQSAVSQSIKQLEHKLGHSLFVRSTKKVQLTPEGEILLQHVKPAIRMLSDGEDLLANSISPMEQIRIAASDTICRYFLIDYFKRFHKEHPEIRIKIINSTSIGCMELLDNGQADLAVCNAPNTRLRSYMRIKKILDFEDIFIASQDFFGDYMDDLVYNNCPVNYLANMPADHPYMALYNTQKSLIVVGQGDWEGPLVESTRRLDTVCAQKGIHTRFEYWGYDVAHDWPWWFKMVAHYVPQLLY